MHSDARLLILTPDRIDWWGISLEIEEFDDDGFGGWGRDWLVEEHRAEAK